MISVFSSGSMCSTSSFIFSANPERGTGASPKKGAFSTVRVREERICLNSIARKFRIVKKNIAKTVKISSRNPFDNAGYSGIEEPPCPKAARRNHYSTDSATRAPAISSMVAGAGPEGRRQVDVVGPAIERREKEERQGDPARPRRPVPRAGHRMPPGTPRPLRGRSRR